MMKLPSIEDLNHIALLMHGLEFGPLPGEFKPGVVAIAQQGVLAYVIDELPTNLVVGFTDSEHAMTTLKRITTINESLDNIDIYMSHVSKWFELSRLYQP